VDTTSLYPQEAQKLPSVGYARSLSVEGVLALAPTQVVATEDAGPPAVIRQLSSSGIPVTVLASNHRFEGLMERIQRVGELTGRVAQASAMQQVLQQDWTRARAQVQQRKTRPARVLFVLAHTPNQIMVAGTDTSAQAMLDYVGASNAITGFSGYKPLTPEAVIAAQPDVVLLTDQGLAAAGGVDGILRLPGLAQTPAGLNRRVISLEAMFLLGFGPRLPAAVSALDAAIGRAMPA
jgi:iron complex transport system substrate-binding protein